MTRKRIRYSELSEPVSPPDPVKPEAAPVELEAAPVEPDAAPVEPESAAIELVHDSAVELQAAPEAPPLIQDLPPRPKRNSTPVELARTLTAERAAALAQDGGAAAAAPEAYAQAVGLSAPEPQRSLREMARRRDGMAELLMFRVGGERFAVELVLVDEVIDLPIIHHVPEMPPAMLGVVMVRGSLTPVYSPRQALGLPLALRDAVLIFRRGGQRVGILIDDVDDAISIDMSELRETVGGDESDSVLLGVVRIESALVGIVDAHALIAACQSADTLETA
jgi:purine-binding chemotaxis protein CheW